MLGSIQILQYERVNIWGVSIDGVPTNGWFKMENPITVDDN